MVTNSGLGRMLLVLALVAACGDDSTDQPRSGATIPEVPAACAGPGRDGAEEVRAFEWQAARSQIASSTTQPVWLGFSRTLSVTDARDELGGLTAHGVLLAYEQKQGTYAKVQQRFPAAAIDDPAFEETAAQVLAMAVSPANAPRIGSPDAFDPVDESVQAGQPPIAGLLVSGDIAQVFASDECLVHSMATKEAPTGPQVSPAIEPDPGPLGDPG
jgi:hypothetical protein